MVFKLLGLNSNRIMKQI